MPTPASHLPPTGLLIVDKPVGPTSMGVCRAVRAKLVRAGAPKRVKVGHGGTLDPYASGVLVVLCGRATTLSNTVMHGEKRYLADIDLAHTSPTDDMEAPPEPVDGAAPSIDAVRDAIARHTGTIMQAPPAFSAMKVDGARAYDLARAGKIDTLEKRPVTIHAIDIRLYRWPRLILDVQCGKGVYIRSLARDIGKDLGIGGMLAGLRRTLVAPFHESTSTPLHALPDRLTQAHLLVNDQVQAILDKHNPPDANPADLPTRPR